MDILKVIFNDDHPLEKLIASFSFVIWIFKTPPLLSQFGLLFAIVGIVVSPTLSVD